MMVNMRELKKGKRFTNTNNGLFSKRRRNRIILINKKDKEITKVALVITIVAIALSLCIILLISPNAGAVTVPTNVVEYVPITFFNYNSVAIPVNTPLAVGAVNTAIGNVIGINALAYSSYYACNLDNAEFFTSTGTLVPSWLEGNILQEYTANTLCTSSSSTNALVNSANILYWVLPPAGFLPSGGTPTTPVSNTLYLGWAGNVLTTANTLFNSLVTGEAPQLSCKTPQSPSTGCTAGQYAEYDTGNIIFGYNGFYDNFAGTNSLPSTGWTGQGSATPTNVVNNGITSVSNNNWSGWQYTARATTQPPGYVEDYQVPLQAVILV